MRAQRQPEQPETTTARSGVRPGPTQTRLSRYLVRILPSLPTEVVVMMRGISQTDHAIVRADR